jgi:hypothetical protein
MKFSTGIFLFFLNFEIWLLFLGSKKGSTKSVRQNDALGIIATIMHYMHVNSWYVTLVNDERDDTDIRIMARKTRIFNFE